MPVLNETFRKYNAKDAYSALRAVKPSLLRDMDEFGLRPVYERIVRPLGQVLVRLNAKGIYVDLEAKSAAIAAIHEKKKELQAQIDEICGRPMDVNGKEFKLFLYQELALIPPKVGKTGLGSTNEDTLKKLGQKYPEIIELSNMAIELRSQDKMEDTFLKGATPMDDGRVYAGFRIGPVTGRLACRKPNFQNIPEGIGRKVFVAPKGYKYIYGDYSQLQGRIFAVLAADQPLLDALAAGWDIHDYNGRDMFDIHDLDVKLTTRQRYFAKTFFFGHILFGGSIESVQGRGAELLSDIPPERIAKLGEEWFDKHPKVKEYRARIEQELYTKRRLVGPFGRPRIFFDPPKSAIRQAFNYPIQNGEGDMVALKLIEIDREHPNELCLQVHDSIMLETPDEQVEERAAWLKELLEQPLPEFGGYKFPVKISIGNSWGDF